MPPSDVASYSAARVGVRAGAVASALAFMGTAAAGSSVPLGQPMTRTLLVTYGAAAATGSIEGSGMDNSSPDARSTGYVALEDAFAEWNEESVALAEEAWDVGSESWPTY